MNALTVPLILVALGSAGLLVLRDSRLLLLAGVSQWLGLAVTGMSTPSGNIAFLKGGAVELVTALVCLGVMGLTLRSVGQARSGESGGKPAARSYILPAATVVAGGIAGPVLAALVPLTGINQIDLAFYWAALGGAIVLGTPEAGNAVKLTLGVLALLNATVLLISVASIEVPGTGLLMLMALSRVGTALLFAYLWNWLAASYGHLSLSALFGRRPEATSREITVVERPLEVDNDGVTVLDAIPGEIEKEDEIEEAQEAATE